MYDPNLIALAVLLQLLIIILMFVTEFITAGIILIPAALLPNDSGDQAGRSSAARKLLARCGQAVTAAISLFPLAMAFLLVLATGASKTTDTLTAGWWVTATGFGGLFFAAWWFMTIGDKFRNVSITKGTLCFPQLDDIPQLTETATKENLASAAVALGGRDFLVGAGLLGLGGSFGVYVADRLISLGSNEVPAENAFASMVVGAALVSLVVVIAGRLTHSGGRALWSIRSMFGPAPKQGSDQLRFSIRLEQRETLPTSLRFAAFRFGRNHRFGFGKGSRVASAGLLAASEILAVHALSQDSVEDRTPDHVRRVALSAAAVIVSPTDQDALRRLTADAEVFDEKGTVKGELAAATEYSIAQRIRVLAEVINDARGIISALVAVAGALIIWGSLN
jgi:hypothetical protein